MSEFREKRTVIEDGPVRGSRPLVETQYGSVLQEDRGMSAGAIVALVVAGIAAAIVITMLILSSQQRNSDEALAQERERNASAQQAQPTQQAPPPVIIVPPSQPATATAPVPSQPAAVTTAPNSTDVELDVNSKLLDDQDLRSYSIDVKVSGAVATLGGHVPTNALKSRAENLAKTVRGVRSVVNNIAVQPD